MLNDLIIWHLISYSHFIPNLGSLSHPHGLEEAPVVQRPSLGHHIDVDWPHNLSFHVLFKYCPYTPNFGSLSHSHGPDEAPVVHTYHVEVQICFQPKFILHVNFYSKPYKMRYISWNSNGHLLRYGNPDMLFLGTLKNKFHFQWFLTINKQNLVLLFWSGFLFDLNFTKLIDLWQPWNFKFVFFLGFYLKMTYDHQFSLNMM